jgi:hypothetical protein
MIKYAFLAKKTGFSQKLDKYIVLPQNLKHEVRREIFKKLQARRDCPNHPTSRDIIPTPATEKFHSSK